MPAKVSAQRTVFMITYPWSDFLFAVPAAFQPRARLLPSFGPDGQKEASEKPFDG